MTFSFAYCIRCNCRFPSNYPAQKLCVNCQNSVVVGREVKCSECNRIIYSFEDTPVCSACAAKARIAAKRNARKEDHVLKTAIREVLSDEYKLSPDIIHDSVKELVLEDMKKLDPFIRALVGERMLLIRQIVQHEVLHWFQTSTGTDVLATAIAHALATRLTVSIKPEFRELNDDNCTDTDPGKVEP